MAAQEILIRDDGIFPGNFLPVLLYKGALDVPLLFPATHVTQLFKKNGWSNSWDAGIFTYHHYHSITHEVLGIYSGQTTVQLGGYSGPKLLLEKGDVLVIPAGVAHKNLNEEDAVGVVGAYPDGRDYDMNYGKPGERPKADERIAAVPIPDSDRLSGKGGELSKRWAKYLKAGRDQADVAG
ncbi:cupin domain-containing protein [Mucilaginibacter limnophilus]|uniref:Cupin domain-containing protein n=1 Tax=Mucilaginibacter limnophilus TaxID=1932778 RepID=A0A3S2X1A8_9SPHI|nr:cupin domain-containing protein [Mucilaginibacter limnophilus]RVU03156.1 cupin domain-containing protein [Mucilaginibacter limnophilus]